MKHIILYGLLILSFTSFGQTDRLQPVRDYLNTYEHEQDYFPYIYKHLVKGLSLTPVVRIVVLPSFSVEQVISIEEVDNKKDFKLILKTCKETIWTSNDRENIEIQTHQIDLDSSFALLVGKVFIKATTEVRYPTELNWPTQDGIIYLVTAFVPGHVIQTGETCSPKEGTRMRQLVDISDNLIAMTKVDKADREKLKKEIQIIAVDFLSK